MKEVKLYIKGMTCTSCVQSIENTLKKLEGVFFVGVNIVDKTAIIKYDSKLLNVKKIIENIRKTGYESYETKLEMKEMSILMLI